MTMNSVVIGSGFGGIAAALRLKAKGHNVDKNAISVPGKTIKRLGSYTAKIRLHREVSIDYPFDIHSPFHNSIEKLTD